MSVDDSGGSAEGGLVPVSDVRGAKEMARDLKTMRLRAFPYAVRNTLNTAAFEARRIWQAEIRASFTNRNQYTVRSIQVERVAGGSDPQRMVARVGSTTDFMGKQEKGGTVTGKSGRKPIPGPVAAGLAPGAKRTRLVRARFHLGAIKAPHPTLTGSRHQRNAIAIAVALREGSKRAVLERPGGRKALFIVGGTPARPTTRLLWDVSRSSVKIKPQPTLQRTLTAIGPKMEHMMQASLLQQLNKFGIPHT
jgi:hypothetical protein